MAAKKPRKTPSGKTAGRVKKTVILDAKTARLLGAVAAWTGQDQSELIAAALEPVLARWYMARKDSSELTPPRLADHSDAA